MSHALGEPHGFKGLSGHLLTSPQWDFGKDQRQCYVFQGGIGGLHVECLKNETHFLVSIRRELPVGGFTQVLPVDKDVPSGGGI